MRWVFWTLLFLNFLVFAAQWLNGGYDERPERTVLSASSEGAPLMLLSEVEGGRSEAAAKSSPAGSHEDLEALCLMVGPAASQSQAQELLHALRQEGVSARMVTQEVAKAPDYWVYLPPLPDRESAIGVLRELQQTRKVDSFLISQGPLANGISLGLFKNREAAIALQQQRNDQGLDARLIEVERNAIEYWVVIPGDAGVLSVQKVTELLAQAKLSAEQRQIYCKSVASAK